jgi:peptide/nickel transport system permease protein
MTRFVIQRLAETALVLFLMSFLIYGLIGLMPGDPVDLMVSANPDLTPADAARLKALYGLDQPIAVRYWNWLGAALSGDLGYSRLFAQPVMQILLPRLANTVVLMGVSFALALAVALPLGLIAAVRPRSALDNIINLGAFAGISIPPFWLAILLIILFSVTLGWLPAGGMGDKADGFWARTSHLILPVATLTLATVGGIVRFVRAAMMEALRQDYIRTARAKGVSYPRVVLGHALRNAMIPVVTILALNFGALFSGALITETMFGWLGMGKTIYDAIMGNDFNLALVGLLFATLTTLLANLVADLAYAWLDPRISYR